MYRQQDLSYIWCSPWHVLALLCVGVGMYMAAWQL